MGWTMFWSIQNITVVEWEFMVMMKNDVLGYRNYIVEDREIDRSR